MNWPHEPFRFGLLISQNGIGEDCKGTCEIMRVNTALSTWSDSITEHALPTEQHLETASQCPGPTFPPQRRSEQTDGRAPNNSTHQAVYIWGGHTQLWAVASYAQRFQPPLSVSLLGASLTDPSSVACPR